MGIPRELEKAFNADIFSFRYPQDVALLGNVYVLAIFYFGLRICIADLTFRVIPNVELLSILALQIFQGFTYDGIFFFLTIFAFGLLRLPFLGSGDIKLVGILAIGISSLLQFEAFIFIALCVGIFCSIPNLRLGRAAFGMRGTVAFAPSILIGYLSVCRA